MAFKKAIQMLIPLIILFLTGCFGIVSRGYQYLDPELEKSNITPATLHIDYGPHFTVGGIKVNGIEIKKRMVFLAPGDYEVTYGLLPPKHRLGGAINASQNITVTAGQIVILSNIHWDCKSTWRKLKIGMPFDEVLKIMWPKYYWKVMDKTVTLRHGLMRKKRTTLTTRRVIFRGAPLSDTGKFIFVDGLLVRIENRVCP